jgi:DNA helicase-2/ATP-dependent DNA helicase PcrA
MSMRPNPFRSHQLLEDLNEAQQRAVTHGDSPLLIVAGAGTGKTTTLARRVAWLIHSGVDPRRLLLLTFTRRAAYEMLRRADALLASTGSGQAIKAVWGGTFHAVAVRLLRRYGASIGLPPNFTILDRSDTEDLLGSLRANLNLDEATSRFPGKPLCAEIYSRVVNSQQPLEDVLQDIFPQHCPHALDLKALFKAYTTRKEQEHLLDYDDLLLFWEALLADRYTGAAVRERFTHVLVDEYQDTNRLQATILKRFRPDGRGLTVVGDDAQAIYAFRAATVRNILDFPQDYPGTTIVALEENYRSTQPILDVANAVIACATERHEKTLRAARPDGPPPVLVRCLDEDSQSAAVIERVLEQHEAGVPLRCQAVLFRASFHSLNLELELNRRGIPFQKYGGLKFLETAHVKDLLAFLRLAENPRDSLSAERLLMLLPGIGHKTARTLFTRLAESGFSFRKAWSDYRAPAASRELWPAFFELLCGLADAKGTLALPGEQVRQTRLFYTPLLENRYDHAAVRRRDLQQLEYVAEGYVDRASFLADLSLDPPISSFQEAAEPDPDQDRLVLSTIHSAKGLEFDAVHVLHAIDGGIPSDMVRTPADLEEERRLFYVALTRAKTHLFVYHPLRYAFSRGGWGGGSGLASLTPFLTPAIVDLFQHVYFGDAGDAAPTTGAVRQRIGRMWD